MSFLSGLADDVSKAWDKTVGNAWDWISKPSQNSVSTESKEPDTKPVTDSSAVVIPEDASGHSLMHTLALLRAEAMHHCETKAKTPYLKVKEAQEKNKTLTNLLQIFTAQSDNKGDFEVKDENTKQLIAQAKNLGVELSNQAKYTKQERDTAIRNLDHSLKVIGDDIRLHFNDTQEALQQRNTFYQELKTCWDKIAEAVRKLIQAISPT